MTQLNDAIHDVVGTQLNDGLLAHYKANGATADDLNGAESQFLITAGATPAHLSDMWHELLGPGHLNDLLTTFWLSGGLFGPAQFSPEVTAVLARMSALTQTEIDAIEAYVDGLVADSVYSNITEIYAPCLNATDFRTGFKFMTLIDSASSPIHTPGEYVDFTAGAQHMLDSEPYDSFATVQGFMGAYIVFTGADVTGNSDLFGIATAGVECYYRWRGTDTNDFNAIYNVTSATPRSVSNVRPTGDMVGVGLEGVETFELEPGGIIVKSTRVPNGAVPATHPCQWHGQNIDGVPSVGNVQNSRYSLMMHSNLILSTVTQGVVRARSLQFLRDIGVTGVPAT